MARPSSSKKEDVQNPEATERRRLKKLAIRNNILSETPVKCSTPLSPSNQVVKHHGKDILRKSQRKNRFLFSFPGLLAPIAGGKIGELKDLGTKNPILYLDFPQGQMKLFGTIVYPKNRYLTLQFSKGGKNVMCEDYFDNMIVFSDAWWIGKKEENPEESQLDFPKGMTEGQPMDFDFKGGAGLASVKEKGVPRTEVKYQETQSPEPESEDDFSDDAKNLKDKMEVTPTRHSARTAGKNFKFAEVSSDDDIVGSDGGTSSGEDAKVCTKIDLTGNVQTSTSCPVVVNIESENPAEKNQFPEDIQVSVTPATKSRKQSQSAVTMNRSKENLQEKPGSLVQATISSLFKKVEEKVIVDSVKSSSSKVPSQRSQQNKLKRKIDKVEAEGSRKKAKVTKESKTGTGTRGKKKDDEVEDGDIEEFSSTSKDTNNGSDGDWAAASDS
ncbi:hypothetical protein SLA2020_334430 [Shorea laevis]